jgi:hypothetical protein
MAGATGPALVWGESSGAAVGGWREQRRKLAITALMTTKEDGVEVQAATA